VLVCIAIGASASAAAAATAEVAKKCQSLTAQAYPPSVPGNPATGTGPAAQKYYRDCVARGGDVSGKPEPTTTGLAGAGTSSADSGGRKQKDKDTYKPCPAAVAIHGRNVCLGLK
jgi:hypothetical protein